MVVMNKNIILMTKIPIHGFSKSRLAQHLGNSNCKRFTLTNIESIKKNILNKRTFNLIFYLTPFNKFRSFSFSFSNNNIIQKGYSLGDKIWYLKSKISKSFLVVGSDIPKIKLKYLSLAFKILKTKDVVIGPTYDKGFWLIGFSNKKAVNNPFKGIRWGTVDVLEDLLKNLKKYNIKTGYCKKLRDIDIFDDYCDYKLRFKNR